MGDSQRQEGRGGQTHRESIRERETERETHTHTEGENSERVEGKRPFSYRIRFDQYLLIQANTCV